MLAAFYLLLASLAPWTHQAPVETQMNPPNQAGRTEVCQTPWSTALSMMRSSSAEISRLWCVYQPDAGALPPATSAQATPVCIQPRQAPIPQATG